MSSMCRKLLKDTSGRALEPSFLAVLIGVREAAHRLADGMFVIPARVLGMESPGITMPVKRDDGLFCVLPCITSMLLLLLDANALLDALVEGGPETAEAWEVLKRCNGGDDMGLVTSGSLKDAYYVLSRGGREAAAREAIELLMELLVIAPVGAEERELSMRPGEPDFEDGLVRTCAELNDVAYILTRDDWPFCTSCVRSLTCAEYLELFAE